MIITHPVLFNTIVVLFIAFTAGWVVYVINNKRSMGLKNRIAELENQKEEARKEIMQLEEQLGKNFAYPFNSASVIALSSRIRKTN